MTWSPAVALARQADMALAARRRVAPAKPVVFVCLVFHPDTSASSILFTDLFVRLARDGTHITALTGFPTKDDPSLVSSLPRRDIKDGVEIVRCGWRLAGKQGLSTRALAYGSFLLHAGWHLVRHYRHARVVGGTDPPFTAAALWLLSGIGRFKYETILLDAYPDGLVALGTLQDRSFLVRAWRALNVRAYHGASAVIVIGRDMIDLLHDRYGVEQNRITYIPHWGPIEVEVSESDRRQLLARLGIASKFVVQYSGNMGLWHDMDALVKVADHLRDDQRIHFLFIGKGRRRAGAESLAHQLGLTNITWLDFVPREELGATLAACDAAFISQRSGLEGIAVPSKLYGILATGRPVLAMVPTRSEVAWTVSEEGCGYVLDPGDSAGMAEAIQRLVESPDLVTEMGRRARAAYRQKYTLAHATSAFHRLWSTSDQDQVPD